MENNKCYGCSSGNIILIEYLGAYDGWLSLKCEDCKKHFHRKTKKEIRSYKQENYGPVNFNFTDGTSSIN